MPAGGFGQHYLESTIGAGLSVVQAMEADPVSTLPGEPENFGRAVVELVDCRGSASELGKQSRFFLGNNALEVAQKKIAQLTADL